MPQIEVEFFGIPRERAGVPSIIVNAATVQTLYHELRQQLPEFAACCLKNDVLASEYLLSINGKQFTRDPTIRLTEGDQVLILSADVGG